MALCKLSGYFMPHPQQVCVETKRTVLVCAHIHCLPYRYCKYCKIIDKKLYDTFVNCSWVETRWQ